MEAIANNSLSSLEEIIKSNKQEDYSLKPYAIRELFRHKEEDIISLITKAIKDNEPSGIEKLLYEEEFGKRKDERAIPLLLKMAEDPLWPVRKEAMRALGKIGSKEGFSLLVKGLEDLKIEVQRAASEALTMIPIDTKEELEMLIPFILNPDSVIRSNIVIVLNKAINRDKITEEILIERLKGLAEEIKDDDKKLFYLLSEIGKYPSLSIILSYIDLGPDREGRLLKLLALSKQALR